MAVYRKSRSAAGTPFAYFRAQREGESSVARPILAFEQVSKYFRPEAPTLARISFTVERGEFVFITGPSGAGKSTLLQMVYRQLHADEGRILFCGRDVAALPARSIPYLRRNIGIVFQDFKVIPYWNVFENVSVPLQILGLRSQVIRSRVKLALERVGLAGRESDRVGNLSGGEAQRVAIARAIVAEPALVLADEPTGNLDPYLALDILTLFEELNKTGVTVLFATHDHSLLDARPHRLLVLENGAIFEPRAASRPADVAQLPVSQVG